MKISLADWERIGAQFSADEACAVGDAITGETASGFIVNGYVLQPKLLAKLLRAVGAEAAHG